MTKKILITGATGFIGKNLHQRLEELNYNVKTFSGDITSFENVYHALETDDFSCIYHFAGISNIGSCAKNPDRAFSVNVTGTFNIVESLKKLNKKTKLVFTSTGQVYAPIATLTEKNIISEASPVNPSSVYSTTKLFSENVISHYFEKNQLGHAVILRLFNHTHRSQQGPFFFPQIFNQLNEAQLNGNDEIGVGNLEVFRDFSLITDLLDLLIKVENTTVLKSVDIFNVCSSQARNLKDLIELLASSMGVKSRLVIDESKYRLDAEYIEGDNNKCRNTFNWAPKKLNNNEFIKEFLQEL